MADDRTDAGSMDRLAVGVVEDTNRIVAEIERFDPGGFGDIRIGIACVVDKVTATVRDGLAMVQEVSVVAEGALPKLGLKSWHGSSSSEREARR